MSIWHSRIALGTCAEATDQWEREMARPGVVVSWEDHWIADHATGTAGVELADSGIQPLIRLLAFDGPDPDVSSAEVILDRTAAESLRDGLTELIERMEQRRREWPGW